MTLADNKQLENLLHNIQKGLKIFSVKELNESIVLVLNQRMSKNQQVEKILSIVCEEYKISRNILIHAAVRSDVQEARKMAYCLLHLELGLPIRHIAERIFFKWHNSIHVAVKYYKEINVKIKSEKEFKEKYDKLKNKLTEK